MRCPYRKPTQVDEKNILVQGGRVRAGYQAGTILFSKADANQPKAILHIIGERPGSGQDAFSVYVTSPKAEKWASKQIDHDITKVACGISEMATKPADGAKLTVKILQELAPKKI